MQRFTVTGGTPLNGQVKSAGSKNAILALLSASLLASEPVTLTNVPNILDVRRFIRILRKLGVQITHDIPNETIHITSSSIRYTKLDFPEIAKMRGSNLLIGSILARFGEVEFSLPGGDRIGTREMDAHFNGLAQLGATISQKEHCMKITGPLKGGHVFLYEPSVTATENLLMAASSIQDTTVIENAACEPHVRNLGEMLQSMGAKIEGLGSNRITIKGSPILTGTIQKTIPDHVDIATFAIAAAVTNGSVTITDVIPKDLQAIITVFAKLGMKGTFTQSGETMNLVIPSHQNLQLDESNGMFSNLGIYTQPWPCFPTDLLSMTIVLATQVKGTTLFFEKMYEERLGFVSELIKMHADITTLDPHRVMVTGPTPLLPRKLISPDIRAGMAYIIAALIAKGESEVYGIEHIHRGYPDIDKRLQSLGAHIRKHD